MGSIGPISPIIPNKASQGADKKDKPKLKPLSDKEIEELFVPPLIDWLEECHEEIILDVPIKQLPEKMLPELELDKLLKETLKVKAPRVLQKSPTKNKPK